MVFIYKKDTVDVFAMMHRAHYIGAFTEKKIMAQMMYHQFIPEA